MNFQVLIMNSLHFEGETARTKIRGRKSNDAWKRWGVSVVRIQNARTNPKWTKTAGSRVL